MNLKYLAVAIFLFLSTLPLVLSAQSVSYADLGGEPRVLPGSIWYPFKEMGRDIERLFTFRTASSLELELDIANSKLAEIMKMAELGNEHKFNDEKFNSAFLKYRQSISKIQDLYTALNDERAKAFNAQLDEFGSHHYGVMSQLYAEESANSEFFGSSADVDALLTLAEERNPDDLGLFKDLEEHRLKSAALDNIGKPTQENIDRALDELKDLYIKKGSPGRESENSDNDTVCATQYEPVCGGDGKTYSNSCLAGKAGAEISHLGECDGPKTTFSRCVVGGCSGELCLSADEGSVASICEWRQEYSCYRNAKCAIQPDGQCGWTQTAELNACINRSR